MSDSERQQSVRSFNDPEKQIVNHHDVTDEEYPTPTEINHDYILQRHGTLELDPMPSHHPDDPLNWSPLKKSFHLGLIAYSCMCATFVAAGIVPAYETMAEDYGVTVPACSYLTSSQILIFGIMPFFVMPLMNKWGRRKFLVLAQFGAFVCNLGGGFAKTYGQQMATRVLAAAFISPCLAVGTVIVTEIFFSHQRGSKNGWWALMITLGTPSGPFIMGFVVKYASVKWVYFIFAIMNFLGFVGWVFSSDTIWCRDGVIVNEPDSLFKFQSKSNDKLTFWSFFSPLKEFKELRVLIPSISYAIVFCYANIVLVVEMPQVFGMKFGLDSVGIGLQMISILIGSVLGELLSGPLSDWWMRRCIAKRNGVKIIEDRLTMSYTGFIFVMVGIIVWGVRLAQSKPMHWNITPLIGAAIASCGNQMVTTILITYSVDVNHKRSVEIGEFINFFRQVIGFIGPFYFPDMFENLGFAGAGGLMAGLVGVFSLGSVLFIQIFYTRRSTKALAM